MPEGYQLAVVVYGESAIVRFNLDTMNNQTRQEAIDALAIDVRQFPTGHAIGQGKKDIFVLVNFQYCCNSVKKTAWNSTSLVAELLRPSLH